MRGDEVGHALVAGGAGMSAVIGLGLGEPEAVGGQGTEDVDERRLQARAEQPEMFVERFRPGGDCRVGNRRRRANCCAMPSATGPATWVTGGIT